MRPRRFTNIYVTSVTQMTLVMDNRTKYMGQPILIYQQNDFFCFHLCFDFFFFLSFFTFVSVRLVLKDRL